MIVRIKYQGFPAPVDLPRVRTAGVGRRSLGWLHKRPLYGGDRAQPFKDRLPGFRNKIRDKVPGLVLRNSEGGTMDEKEYCALLDAAR